MKKLFALLAALLLSACSTSPITEQTGKHVTAERIYAPQLIKTENNPNKAQVSFFRDSGILGSACSMTILVNNVKAFALHQGEFAHLALDPGAYFFRMEMGHGLCPNFAISQNTILKEGGKEVYRLLTIDGGGIQMTRIE